MRKGKNHLKGFNFENFTANNWFTKLKKAKEETQNAPNIHNGWTHNNFALLPPILRKKS